MNPTQALFPGSTNHQPRFPRAAPLPRGSVWLGKWWAPFILTAFVLAGAAAEPENLVANPGFEKDPINVPKTDARAVPFVEKGWDLGDADKAVFVPDWVYHISHPSALVRIIEDATGKVVHSGKRCLFVNGRKSHIYTAFPKERVDLATKSYTISLYAKGAGTLEIWTYEYHFPGGVQTNIHCSRLLREAVSDQWEKYETPVTVKSPVAKLFYLALVFEGEVGVDDVTVAETAK